METQFSDRQDAGQQLATVLLDRYAGRADVRVFGLPRGGVPVAYEVARALHAPLDVIVVRKLGAPGNKEFAMGAIASGGVVVLTPGISHALGLSQADLDALVASERAELERREQMFRRGKPPPDLSGRHVILVDDGLATGSTMHAAVEAVRQQKPENLVVAVPVAAADSCDSFRAQVDEVVCLKIPAVFRAVGLWYRHFEQTSDEEVCELLDRAEREQAADSATPRQKIPGAMR